MTACGACLRRGFLLDRLSGHMETVRGKRHYLREVLALSDEDLIAAVGGRERARLQFEHDRSDVTLMRRRLAAAHMVGVCRHDDRYPPALRDLRDAPAILFVAGSVERLVSWTTDPAATATVAIVGARRASEDARVVARTIARDLSLAGVPVISGMAMGIDAAAHRGALEGGAQTVAVLGSGPDVAYPLGERRLHGELIERAVVVSELPPGSTARKWTFPARNRIIAGLARLTIVVEAAERSGSLITATCAQDLGRDVGAVPGRPMASGTRGSNGLLRDGCAVIRDSQDALDQLFGAGARTTGALLGDTGALDPALRRTLEEVRAGAETIGALCTDSSQVGGVMAALGELEFLGYVRRTGEGRYVTAA